MTLVPKIGLNPRLTDRQLINLILKSPELTRAFGAKSMLAWDLLDQKSNDPSSKLSALTALKLK